jgi:curved DNA-binding protein CbpA
LTHDKYLEILHLPPGATKEEVKAAYRKLSKQYHPDLNPSAGAHEKFIQIQQAYDFLTARRPYPRKPAVTYDYDPSRAAREYERQQAYEKARNKAREEKERVDATRDQVLRYFNYLASLIVACNLLLAADYYSPRQEYVERIREVRVVVSAARTSGRHLDVFFESFRMRFRRGINPGGQQFQEGVIIATPLLRVPMFARFESEDGTLTLRQAYNVYHVFGYLIPGIFLILGLYAFGLRNNDHRLVLAVLVTIFFITQLILYFRF